MKLLLVILSLGFLTQSQASIISHEFKKLSISEQVQITTAINDIQYYSEHQAVVGGVKIRSEAMNFLRSKITELMGEPAYLFYSNFNSELELAKSKLERVIELHNRALKNDKQAAAELKREAESLDAFKAALYQD